MQDAREDVSFGGALLPGRAQRTELGSSLNLLSPSSTKTRLKLYSAPSTNEASQFGWIESAMQAGRTREEGTTLNRPPLPPRAAFLALRPESERPH